MESRVEARAKLEHAKTHLQCLISIMEAMLPKGSKPSQKVPPAAEQALKA